MNMIACVPDMQQLPNMDPGPAVGTQLTQQLAHRSTALWEMPAAGEVRSCNELWTCRNHFFFFLYGSLITCK